MKLLTAPADADVVTDGVKFSGPVRVGITGDTVLGGATVTFEIAYEDVDEEYVSSGAVFDESSELWSVLIDAVGDHFLRVNITDTSGTSSIMPEAAQ